MAKKFYITYSGHRVDPTDLASLHINLVDIAHHLTNIQRFGGALPFDRKYSVAEHSMNMANYALQKYDNQDLAAYCLLHDATEAYLGDVVSPLKRCLKDYEALENRLAILIARWYELDLAQEPGVYIIDKSILLDEVKALMPKRFHVFQNGNPELQPLGIEIESGIEQRLIKQRFLRMAKRLGLRD